MLPLGGENRRKDQNANDAVEDVRGADNSGGAAHRALTMHSEAVGCQIARHAQSPLTFVIRD